MRFSFQLYGLGSSRDTHNVHWDRTILDKVASKVVSELMRLGDLRLVEEATLCWVKLWFFLVLCWPPVVISCIELKGLICDEHLKVYFY